MSRSATHDILSTPEPGFFLIRLVRKGWKVAARITLDDGLYRAEINGSPSGPAVADPLENRSVMRIWETGEKVEEGVYRHRLALKEWAENNDRTHPAANPRTPIDLANMNPLWRT